MAFHTTARFSALLLLLALATTIAAAQGVTTFEGIDAAQLPSAGNDIDPNGAVGTKQYLEWTNVAFQAFDKTTFAPVWPSPKPGNFPWTSNKISGCNIAGDGYVIFDRLASRWVIAGHNAPGISGPYYYCIAVSSTDDLASSTLAWYAYQIPLDNVLGTNANGHLYFPDWPKLGAWADAYYLGFDLLDPDNHYMMIGAAACAIDRAGMLAHSTLRPMQCFTDPLNPPTTGRYLSHSFIPADIDSTTAPPTGRDEFLVSIQNPPLDGSTLTSASINLWDFHLDWDAPSNSTFTNVTLHVPTYEPGCYNLSSPGNTFCVLEPAVPPSGTGHRHIDSVGDRLMPRLAYHNFGTYESFLVSHTVRVATNASSTRTGIRWYELRGSGVPALFQSGTINPDTALYRFMPSIAQDAAGNAAVGYSIASATVHPGIRASWWNLNAAGAATELNLFSGSADEQNATNWGDYSSMTVDPVNGCTFWYVNEYFQTPQISTINWHTRIANFTVPSCAAKK